MRRGVLGWRRHWRSSGPAMVAGVSTAAVRLCGKRLWWWLVGMSNTLLGPETISMHSIVVCAGFCADLRQQSIRWPRFGCGLLFSDGVGLVLVENCTVDASIRYCVSFVIAMFDHL